MMVGMNEVNISMILQKVHGGTIIGEWGLTRLSLQGETKISRYLTTLVGVGDINIAFNNSINCTVVLLRNIISVKEVTPMVKIYIVCIITLYSLSGCMDSEPKHELHDNKTKQDIAQEDKLLIEKPEDTMTLEEGMLLDKALESLLAMGLKPEEYNPAMDVKGSAEWKLFRVGVRNYDVFFF